MKGCVSHLQYMLTEILDQRILCMSKCRHDSNY